MAAALASAVAEGLGRGLPLPDCGALGSLAAAEVTLALGIILYAFRARGHIDLGEGLDADEVRADTREVTGENSGAREASATATAASPAATSTTSPASSSSSPEVTS